MSYGETLVELGAEHDDFLVFDADLAAATQKMCIRDRGNLDGGIGFALVIHGSIGTHDDGVSRQNVRHLLDGEPALLRRSS